MLTELQKLLLENLKIKADRTAIQPGNYNIPPFMVTVGGSMDVLEDEAYTPTVDIPLIPTVALALKKMGIQREHFLKVMSESVNEVLLQNRSMRAALLAQSGLEEFEAEFRRKVLAELPNKTRKGKVLAHTTVQQVVQTLVR